MHSIPQDTDRVNGGVPGPEEPCWVLLICSFKVLHDPETGEEVGLEFSLDHAVSPKDGGPASADDPATWAEHSTADGYRQGLRERLGWGEFGDTWMRSVVTGFVADGELHVTLGGEPQPISRDRPARVVYRKEDA
jgi:hypothetical protein